MRAWLFVSLLVCSTSAVAQSAQATDIYLFDIHDQYRLSARVTDRNGYDNQPAFTKDSKALLFTSDRAGDQTDIFRYDIATGTTVNLTNTPDENEFSGQPWGMDGFMYVLQEGTPYQNVWYRSWDNGAPQRVLSSYIPVGYFARNNAGVLFWGRYSNALFFEPTGSSVGAGNGESLFLLGSAGISLHAIPAGNTFSFVQKHDSGNWVITMFDPASRALLPLTPISTTNEHYCWAPSGMLLTMDGTSLRKFVPHVDKDWQPVATLSAPGFVRGGRCAVSPDGRYLALVNIRSRP